jgi:DNA-binding transcriptional ArsR family regulator
MIWRERMPVDTSELFRPRDVRLAAIARALGHPARIVILRELAKRNTCVCGEIVHRIPLAQATVSQHLKELKEVGLISGEVDGPRSCYCINREKSGELRKVLDAFFGELGGSEER